MGIARIPRQRDGHGPGGSRAISRELQRNLHGGRGRSLVFAGCGKGTGRDSLLLRGNGRYLIGIPGLVARADGRVAKRLGGVVGVFFA